MKNNKKGAVANSTFVWVVVILVVAFGGLFVWTSSRDGTAKTITPVETTPSTTGGTGTSFVLQCNADTSYNVPLSFKEKYNTGTPVTPDTVTVFEDGVELTGINNSIRATRGKTYEIIVETTGYVTAVDKFTAGCDPVAGRVFLLAPLMDLNDYGNKLYCYDKQSNILDGVLVNYTINTGVQPNVACVIEPPADHYYPGAVWVFSATQITYDEVRLAFPGAKTASLPEQHTGTSGMKDYAFLIPAIDGGKSTANIQFTVTPMTKSGKTPVNADSIKLATYEFAYGIDAKTGRIITTDFATSSAILNAQAGDFGFALVDEDSQGNNLGQGNFVINQFIPVQG